MPEKPQEYCRYVVTKLDVEVMPLVKAAASLAGKSVQEWLSDLANDAAAKIVKRQPVKRKPPKPRQSKRPD